MRTKSSVLNMAAAWGGQMVALLMQLIVRMVFVQYLSNEYLGLSGLFSNILSMLSLVELGVGPAMTFSLYKPLAEHDTEKVKSLMRLYQVAYRAIGAIILALGVLTIPIYPYLINGKPDIPYLNLIYFLFVFNTGVSYFYSYKRSLISSDQKRYVETLTHYLFYFLYNLVQIVVLVLTQNYILFLVCQVVSTVLENFTLSKMADRMYPYLKEKSIAPLPQEDVAMIKRNVGAMVFHKVGAIIVNGTDNILITKFIGLAVTGLYSNYTIILNALKLIVSQVFKSITASVGNLNAVESEKKITEVFYKTLFANFWIYGFCAICLECLFQPFISIWLGEQFLLDQFTVTMLVLSFFFAGMRQAVLTFRDATATYYYDRYKPLFESVVNLIASIALVQSMGIAGIFLGTIISTLTVCTWVEPYVLYKHVLKCPLKDYFKKYLLYCVVTLIAGLVTYRLALLPQGNIYWVFVIRCIICVVVPNVIFLIVFFKTSEFVYFKNMAFSLAQKILKRKKSA